MLTNSKKNRTVTKHQSIFWLLPSSGLMTNGIYYIRIREERNT